jgi:hypothetical protein
MSVTSRLPRLPTRADDWQLLGRTIRLVLGIPRYGVLAGLLAGTALSVFVFSQNIDYFLFVLGAGYLTPGDKVVVLLELFPLVGTSYAVHTGLALVAIAVLSGVDIAMVVYHVREHGLSRGGGGGSALGVALGLLGAGCAACGSAILAGLLSLVGAAGLVTALPLDGFEFSLLALAVLVLSLYWLADGMRGGEIRGCPVDVGE